MGYYTGTGVVSGGGQVIRDLGYAATPKGNVWQRITTTNTIKNGVSLATA